MGSVAITCISTTWWDETIFERGIECTNPKRRERIKLSEERPAKCEKQEKKRKEVRKMKRVSKL